MSKRASHCFVVFSVMLIGVCGCEQSPAPPAKQPAAASSPSATGSTDLNRFLEGQKPATRTPPTSDTSAAHPPTGIPTPPPPAASGDPTWDVPEGWKSVTPSSSMRRAQYALPRADGDTEDGEMLVFYFGQGQGGAVDANLARWRGQVTTADGQPVADSDVKRETFESNGMKVTLLEVSGRYDAGMMPGVPAVGPRDNYRMLAAMVETPRGPWFFKATGPKATMEKHADAVRTMLKSVRR